MIEAKNDETQNEKEKRNAQVRKREKQIATFMRAEGQKYWNVLLRRNNLLSANSKLYKQLFASIHAKGKKSHFYI